MGLNSQDPDNGHGKIEIDNYVQLESTIEDKNWFKIFKRYMKRKKQNISLDFNEDRRIYDECNDRPTESGIEQPATVL